jgi:TPR repeat protein
MSETSHRPRTSASRGSGAAHIVGIALLAALSGYGAAHLTRVDAEATAQAAFRLGNDALALATWRAEAARIEASISFLYRRGLGIARDDTVADEHYRTAIALDEAAAAHAMGVMYLARPTGDDDISRARFFCDLAFQKGVVSARFCNERAITLFYDEARERKRAEPFP